MLKIGIIDDDLTTRKILKYLVKKNFNCILFEAKNGKEGLEMMLKQKPDIVLLDIAMPEMDGLSLLQTKRKIPNIKRIPVIIITAFGQEELVRQSLNLGVENYILKPVNSKELAERIYKVVQKTI